MIWIRQTFASLYSSKPGGTRCAPERRAATFPAFGLPKRRAARAEVSTTLMAVTVRTDDGGGVGWRLEAEAADVGKECHRGAAGFLADGCLHDGEEFAWQRAVVLGGALAEAVD